MGAGAVVAVKKSLGGCAFGQLNSADRLRHPHTVVKAGQTKANQYGW